MCLTVAKIMLCLLLGEYRQDHDNMIRAIMKHMNSVETDKYMLRKVVQSYRRMNPQRGMEYLITVVIRDQTS